jgi:hypothetical protein
VQALNDNGVCFVMIWQMHPVLTAYMCHIYLPLDADACLASICTMWQ